MYLFDEYFKQKDIYYKVFISTDKDKCFNGLSVDITDKNDEYNIDIPKEEIIKNLKPFIEEYFKHLGILYK